MVMKGCNIAKTKLISHSLLLICLLDEMLLSSLKVEVFKLDTSPSYGYILTKLDLGYLHKVDNLILK